MDDRIYFENFIIKQLVSKVNFDPDSEKYSFNDIHISDEIIRNIENEGAKYGIKKELIGDIIARVAQNIKTEPYREIINYSIKPQDLKEGQHFRINIIHPDKGKMFIDLLTFVSVKGGKGFFVLDSNIHGLCHGDELRPTDKVWNRLYYADFELFRNKKRFPTTDYRLRIGKIDSFELCNPSVVYEIIDSDETFLFQRGKNRLVINKYNIGSLPRVLNGKLIFKWWGERASANTPFVIIDDDSSSKAELMVNSEYIPRDRDFYVDNFLLRCCEPLNEYIGTEGLVSIIQERKGELKRTCFDEKSKEWELEVKPQIKFVYGNE